MSLPNIPNILPEISLERCKTIELLLSSIALEEISLSHILNAEGEKLQSFLKTNPTSLNDYLKINASVNQTIRSIIKTQMLLHFKLEDVLALDEKSDYCRECPSPEPTEPTEPVEPVEPAPPEPEPISPCDHFFEDDDF